MLIKLHLIDDLFVYREYNDLRSYAQYTIYWKFNLYILYDLSRVSKKTTSFTMRLQYFHAADVFLHLPLRPSAIIYNAGEAQFISNAPNVRSSNFFVPVLFAVSTKEERMQTSGLPKFFSVVAA